MTKKIGYLLRTVTAVAALGFAVSAQAAIGSGTDGNQSVDMLILSCGSLTKTEESCQLPQYQFSPGPNNEDGGSRDARIPEPGSLALFALGLIGYGISRRRS
jgi:hypothetical protein